MPITIAPFPPQVDPALIDRLSRCETGTIGHFEHDGFLDPRLRALNPGARVAGTAITLRAPSLFGGLSSWLIAHARPGDFIVIDRAGESRHANWGYVTSLAARLTGIVGIVVDGPTTDVGEQREHGIPCWCSGPAAITVKGGLPIEGAVNVPVSVGGVAIHPGDAILADENGIFVTAPARLEPIIAECERRQAAEQITLERLRNGESLIDIFGLPDAVRAALPETLAQGPRP
jgi:4-hydroxy-4-methyl-2-oxoglutarate aldolase